MATKQVDVPGIGIITLYKRRGNRSLRLSIGADSEIRVSLPYWLPYKAGEQFALSKRSWIVANRSYAQQLRHGHAIGKAHHIYFEVSPSALKIQARVLTNEVRISFPPEYTAHETAVQSAARKASLRALRKEAEALLPQRLQALSAKTSLQYTTLSIKQLKSRWGSCSTDRNITLNVFLIQLPWHLIDYVLIHELAHTRVMQHGAPFWREMERHLPEAKKLRKQISSYRPVLVPAEFPVRQEGAY